MQVTKKYEQGFATILVGLILVIVAIVGFAGYHLVYKPNVNAPTQNREDGQSSAEIKQDVQDEQTEEYAPNENQPSETEPSQQQPQKPLQGEFNAEAFYNKVQVGITSAEVQKLAGGKVGECAQTAVYPPSGNVSCTWSDTTLRVTVNFTDDKVISKQKASL
jgi:hypothetical protein